MLNPFRLLGDLSHLASIFILLHKIVQSRSCRGISFKTQLLYLVVFCTRYLDLFTDFSRMYYNSVMKIFFLGSSGYIIYLMKYRFRPTQDPSIDTFKIEYPLGVSFLLALVLTPRAKYSFIEVAWTFSILLESVAILPQLFMLSRTGEAENLTAHYIAALGAYRMLYIPNWIWRYASSSQRLDDFWIVFLAGVLQTGLYADFAYIYMTKVFYGKKFELPV